MKKPRPARTLEVRVRLDYFHVEYFVVAGEEEWGHATRICAKHARRLFGRLQKTGEHRFVLTARRVHGGKA